MPYIHRNAQNEITGLTRWPNGSSERLPDDHPDVVAFRNPPPQPSREDILADALDAAPNDTARWGLLTAFMRG